MAWIYAQLGMAVQLQPTTMESLYDSEDESIEFQKFYLPI